MNVCPASGKPIGRLPFIPETTICEACGQACRVRKPTPKEKRAGLQATYGTHFLKEPEQADRRTMTATGNCEYKIGDGTVCGKPTNESWRNGGRDFYFCHEHLKAGAEQVSGIKFKDSPTPKK